LFHCGKQIRVFREGLRHALVAKARPLQVTASPWSVYGEANYAGGNRDAQTFLSSYDYRSPGGSIGREYKVNPNLRVGAVFGYTQPNVDLTVQNAHYKIDAFQFGGYRRRRISASGVPAELAAPHYAGPGRATPRFAISSASPRINGDFNDPDAIPGLGPLLATDGVPAVLTQVSSKSENITEAVRESPVSAKLNRSCIADPEPKLDEPCSAESGNRFTEQSDQSGRGNGERSHR